jgi:hypothetical protein
MDEYEKDSDPKYICEVLQVNLQIVDPKELESTLKSCDWKLTEQGIVGNDGFFVSREDSSFEICLVDCCVGYGTYAPIDSVDGNHYPDRIRAKARQLADRYMKDEEKLNKQLDRTVNGLGSTARDFGRGDVLAGLRRHEEAINSKPVVKTIKQSNLSSECWLIQFRGPDACVNCEYRNTNECGGQEIRKTGHNEKGIAVGNTGL